MTPSAWILWGLTWVAWGIILLSEGLNVAAGLRQWRHPFATPRWQHSWGIYSVVHGLLGVRWGLGVALSAWEAEIRMDFGLPLLISLGFYLFSREMVYVFQSMDLVVEPVPPGSVTVDTEGHILEWNIYAEYLLGWAAGEVLGKDFVDLVIPAFHQAAHRQEMAQWMAAQAGPGPYTLRVTSSPMLHKDGHIEQVYISMTSVLRPDGVTMDFHKSLRKLIPL